MWHRVYLVFYSVLSWLCQSCPERSLCSVCLEILTFSRTTSPCLLLCISMLSFSSYQEICLSCLSSILLYLMQLCSAPPSSLTAPSRPPSLPLSPSLHLAVPSLGRDLGHDTGPLIFAASRELVLAACDLLVQHVGSHSLTRD